MTELIGVAAFLAASTFAERFPVPVEGADANGVSLGFVFAVAALVLFGWAPATFIYATAPDARRAPRAQPLDPHRLQRRRLRDRRHARRRRSLHLSTAPGPAAIRLEVALTAADPLRGEPPARDRGDRGVGVEARLRPPDPLERALDDPPVRADGVDSADAGRALAALTPYLFVALAGPLVAISLYQRSTHKALERDAARAHRPADRARQPPPLPRAAPARARESGRRRRASSRSACSTSTTSSRSTTGTAIRPATASSPGRGAAAARAARRSGLAATSSRCCCRGSSERRPRSRTRIVAAHRRRRRSAGRRDLA